MSTKRKNISFRDTPADMAVYAAISDFRSYGFSTESRMVIESVKYYITKKNSDFPIEELADMIAARLSKMNPVPAAQEDPPAENPDVNAALDAALSFLEQF